MPTTPTATQPTVCLLHADVHVMEADCWGATLDWYLAHADLDHAEARDDYQAAVERKMLDQIAQEQAARP